LILEECFNSPYGNQHFQEYSEAIATGETCKLLSKLAAGHQLWIIGGSIPEAQNGRLYNSCPVFDSSGEHILTYRKV